MFRFVACMAFLLCVIDASSGAEPTDSPTTQPLDLFELGAPSFTNFSSRDGLPDTVTVSTQTDREGFVWVASPAGIFRYDGRHWAASENPATAYSADNLWLDQNGTLWAAFRDHGLARYDGTRWQMEDRSTGLPSLQVRRFSETHNADGSQTLWALTWDQGLMRREGDKWVLDAGNAQLPHSSMLSMAQTRRIGGHERQWVGSGNEGLWYRDNEEGAPGAQWQRFRAPEFDPTQVEYLLTTEHAGREELWISVFGAGLWRLTEDGMRKWTRESGDLPTNDLYDIAETPLSNGDRAIWVSSRSGLVRIHDDHAQLFDRRHGLPSDAVRGLSVWRSPNGDEVLWLATESGVARTIIGANQWLTASLMGAHATGVFSVLVEPDERGSERLWVGASDNGVGLFEQGRWRFFTSSNGALPDSNVRMIAATADEHGQRTHWVGLRFGHLMHVRDGPIFEAVDTPWENHIGEAVFDTLTRRIDGHYEQWFGLRQAGIYRKRDGVWTAFRADSAVGQWRICKFVEQIDASGRSWLWAATNQGLARFDGERWRLLGRETGMPDTDLLGVNLIADARGHPVLWVGTTNAGIARVDISDPQHPQILTNDLPPPPDLTAYSALRDSSGRVYICTNNGVQQLTPNAGGYVSHVFARKDGMAHDECNTNAQFMDSHDRFWTGTLGGLTVYDPQRAVEDSHAKALKIIDMRVDDKVLHGSSLQIEPSMRDVSIEFALLSWRREGESRFRTQLIGYDAKPGEWSAQNSRSFNALPPGHYVLRIEGRDYAGNLSQPVQLPIDMAAQWWQELWARIVFAAAVLLLGYAAVLWRTRALKAQRSDLEQRVTARTIELNDANARLLDLSYMDALTGLAKRRRLLETLDQGPRDGQHGAPTALIFIDVDDFKDYNDRHGHPAGDEALRGVASTMRRCAPPEALVARYGGEEFACLWPHASVAQGIALAERMREAVAACDIMIPGSALTQRVTISAGVAGAIVSNSADAYLLLRDADMALYQAKRDGRNRVRALAKESDRTHR